MFMPLVWTRPPSDRIRGRRTHWASFSRFYSPLPSKSHGYPTLLSTTPRSSTRRFLFRFCAPGGSSLPIRSGEWFSRMWRWGVRYFLVGIGYGYGMLSGRWMRIFRDYLGGKKKEKRYRDRLLYTIFFLGRLSSKPTRWTRRFLCFWRWLFRWSAMGGSSISSSRILRNLLVSRVWRWRWRMSMGIGFIWENRRRD